MLYLIRSWVFVLAILLAGGAQAAVTVTSAANPNGNGLPSGGNVTIVFSTQPLGPAPGKPALGQRVAIRSR